MKILAFETSCDETSVAVVEDNFRVLSNLTTTQLEHALFGGVVPELASRAQMRLIWPQTEKALLDAGVSLETIDVIAATTDPGLIGALLVGVVFGKTLAQVLQKPFVGVNHLEGHMFSIFLSYPQLKPPILYLLVSGGHTCLIWMEDFFNYQILGKTQDDAAGEAFDKVGRLLGLPYPAGGEVDRLSQSGDPKFIHFPRAKVPELNFSFSGLKTAVLYYLKREKEWEKNKSSIAASFQEAVVDMLLNKVIQGIEKTGAQRVAVVGGVALNSRLRKKFPQDLPGVELYFPAPEYTTDNAAMIGACVLRKYISK